MGILVVEAQAQGAQAREQREAVDALEQRLFAVRLREAVVGDPRGEVVDVVEADVAGEPLHKSGQLKV